MVCAHDHGSPVKVQLQKAMRAFVSRIVHRGTGAPLSEAVWMLRCSTSHPVKTMSHSPLPQ
jgi:hypothetical protein